MSVVCCEFVIVLKCQHLLPFSISKSAGVTYFWGSVEGGRTSIQLTPIIKYAVQQTACGPSTMKMSTLHTPPIPPGPVMDIGVTDQKQNEEETLSRDAGEKILFVGLSQACGLFS